MYCQDPNGGNQPQRTPNLSYSVSPRNVLTLAPLGAALQGLSCGSCQQNACQQAGLGKLGTIDLTDLTDPTTLAVYAGTALVAGWFLFGGSSKKARRKKFSKIKDTYLSKKFALEAQ